MVIPFNTREGRGGGSHTLVVKNYIYKKITNIIRAIIVNNLLLINLCHCCSYQICRSHITSVSRPDLNIL